MAKADSKTETQTETPKGVDVEALEKENAELKAKVVILEKTLVDKEAEISAGGAAIDEANKAIDEVEETILKQAQIINEQRVLIQQQAAGEIVGVGDASVETKADREVFNQAIKDGLVWSVASVGERFYRADLCFTKAGTVYTLTPEQLEEIKKEPNLTLKQVTEIESEK